MTFTGKVMDVLRDEIEGLKHTMRVENCGMWCYPLVETTGCPRYWLLPSPHHPLEAIGAMRSSVLGGLMALKEWADTNPLVPSVLLRRDYERLVKAIAHSFGTTPETIKFLWHVLTPMNVPETPLRYNGVLWLARKFLFDAAGLDLPDYSTFASAAPFRPDFWSKELEGRIEL